MTNDIGALVDRVRQQTASGDAATLSGDDRQKLLRVAQEFESMLLVQVLKDMRRAGRWDDEDENGAEKSGLGADTLFEMADTELAGQLTRVQGFGLSKQLLDAFDRLQGTHTAPPADSIRNGIAVPMPPSPPGPPQIPEVIPSGDVAAGTIEAGRDAAAAVGPTSTPDTAPVAGSPTVPTVDGHVTSQFGWRRDPFTGQTRFHRGVDLAAVYGQDVQAARAGRVVFSGGQGGYGNTVVIEHADGTRTRYAHLSATLVSNGDVVDSGQVVGRAGHSGRATGTHVHFEVTSADGRPIAPDAWMKQS